jgi:esterase/lipase superfamily enzyme
MHLSRDFEMLVFGHSGFPIILFPTAKGRYYEYKDNGLINSVEHLLDSGVFKIYCPDGIDNDSWYNYSIHPADRVKTHNGYENVILYDVIAFAQHETGYTKVGLAGCNLGGYHAVNTALRHPDLVSVIISMSGSYDIRPFIFGYYDDNCYFNNPPDYLPRLDDAWYLDRIKSMEIILGCSEWDDSKDENYRLSNIFKEKGIPHWLDVRPQSKNEWETWKQMFPLYLDKIRSEF